MANLVVDIGNTLTKIAVFERDEMLFEQAFQTVRTEIIDRLIDNHNITKAIISSVKKEKADWEHLLAGKIATSQFSAQMATGIKNHYLTPATLGLDRLAAVVGANSLYKGKDSLVIDGGTCITYDWIDKDGNYYGGSISPGLKMRYKALNYYTSALPLAEVNETFDDNFGNSTITAMQSGVQNGIKYEITGFIESYKKDEKTPNIVLTGGDGIFFDTLLKNSIFAPYIKNEPYLVLKGLNAAIQNNND